MAKKGSKNASGIPALWDEMKKRVNITLTPTAIAGLDELAATEGMSRSEFVERIGRKIFTVNTKPE
jgi:metal-responsive CopG/Arc/MetJ family transcriptional regulator